MARRYTEHAEAWYQQLLNFDLMIRCCCRSIQCKASTAINNPRFGIPMRLFKPLCTVGPYLWVIALGSRVPCCLGPAAPHRSVAMQPIESGRDPSAFEAKVRGNSYLSGVCLHIGWKDIEKEPGHLDLARSTNTWRSFGALA